MAQEHEDQMAMLWIWSTRSKRRLPAAISITGAYHLSEEYGVYFFMSGRCIHDILISKGASTTFCNPPIKPPPSATSRNPSLRNRTGSELCTTTWKRGNQKDIARDQLANWQNRINIGGLFIIWIGDDQVYHSKIIIHIILNSPRSKISTPVIMPSQRYRMNAQRCR